MNEVTITVRGSHETRIAPERAIAHVTARVDGPARGGVVERIAALAAPVRADLTERKTAGAVAEWSSQRVSVWSERPWNAEGRQLDLVHHASVEFTATFTDFMLLSDWLNGVAENDGLQVGSVEWELSPETRARVEREVAAAAVTVAVERATAYASAIGRGTVTPLEIADPGLLTGHGDPGAGPQPLRMARSAMAMDAGGAPAVDFQPDDLVVSASVEARFTAR